MCNKDCGVSSLNYHTLSVRINYGWCDSGFHKLSLAEILMSNSVGTQLFFLGCNQDNNPGSNFITKKKICLVLPEKEISNHRN